MIKELPVKVTYTSTRFDFNQNKLIVERIITINSDDNTVTIKTNNQDTILETKVDHNKIIELFNDIQYLVDHKKEDIVFIDDCGAEIKLTYHENKQDTYDRGASAENGVILEDLILDFIKNDVLPTSGGLLNDFE